MPFACNNKKNGEGMNHIFETLTPLLFLAVALFLNNKITGLSMST